MEHQPRDVLKPCIPSKLGNLDASSLLSPCGSEESVQNLLWPWLDPANFSRRRIGCNRSSAPRFDRQYQDSKARGRAWQLSHATRSIQRAKTATKVPCALLLLAPDPNRLHSGMNSSTSSTGLQSTCKYAARTTGPIRGR